MLGAYDFCGYYEWTFAWLDRRGGTALVRQYWDEAIRGDSQRHAADLVREKGFAGMAEYWGHTLAEESAGYTAEQTADSFRIDMQDCPSKGFLIRNQLEQYPDYCDHCIGWIGPLMQSAGYRVDHEHNHRGQCWWAFHLPGSPPQSNPAVAPVRGVDAAQWNPEETVIDRWVDACRVDQKTPGPNS